MILNPLIYAGLALIVLKLGDVLGWSWWLVLSPFLLLLGLKIVGWVMLKIADFLETPEERNAREIAEAFHKYKDALLGDKR